MREVIQRPLAADRLVDRMHDAVGSIDPGKAAVEREVGGLGEPALDLQLPIPEGLEGLVGRQPDVGRPACLRQFR